MLIFTISIIIVNATNCFVFTTKQFQLALAQSAGRKIHNFTQEQAIDCCAQDYRPE